MLRSIFNELLLVLLLTTHYLLAVPVYGTKRYGKNLLMRHPSPAWSYSPRINRYPISYYEALYPYASDYDDYYYQPANALAYPIYYPSRNPSKYDFYYPVYYGDRRPYRSDYDYYISDPMDDVQEEIQEEDHLERNKQDVQDSLPWYTGYSDDESTSGNNDDVNTAFFNNLMLAQKSNSNNKQLQDPYYYDVSRPDAAEKTYYVIPTESVKPDDEEVKELTMLKKPEKNAKKQKSNKKELKKKESKKERLENLEKSTGKNKKVISSAEPNDSEAWRRWNDNKGALIGEYPLKKFEYNEHGTPVFGRNNIAFTDRKPQLANIASTLPPSDTTVSSQKTPKNGKGQKEVVLLRPATPVKHPFSNSVMEILNKSEEDDDQRKRTPSVYDKIKYLLEFEKSMEKESQENYLAPQMKKRFVSSEGSLVEQLSKLKKSV